MKKLTSGVNNRARTRTAIAAGLISFGMLALMPQAVASVIAVRGFEGTSQLDNCALGGCFRPPDTMGAVGTTQFVETSNGSVTVYNKADGSVLSRVGMNSFWTAAGQGASGGDQRILFDHYTNRWIAIGFGATNNVINIGVSVTADALGPWKSTALVGPAGTTLDYPTLGMDNKGVYIGTNNFNSSSNFVGNYLITIPKSSLFGGVTPLSTDRTVFITPYTPGTNDRGFAIQAAVKWDGNATNSASVIADSRDQNAQIFYKLNGVDGPGATQGAATIIAGSQYTNAANPARQPDGTRTVDTLSPRISANSVQVGDKLYSVATIQSAVGDYSDIRWTVVDANTGVLLSSGKIDEGNFDYFEGSIAVNELGEAVIGYNRSGFQMGDLNGDGKDDGNISFLTRAFTVGATGGLTQDGIETILRVSDVSNYHCTTPVTTPPTAPCRERWGDFSAVTIDPTDHNKFWAIGEYADDQAIIPGFTTTPRSIWHTYIAEITTGQVPGQVPEPSTYALMFLGLALVAGTRRRKAS